MAPPLWQNAACRSRLRQRDGPGCALLEHHLYSDSGTKLPDPQLAPVAIPSMTWADLTNKESHPIYKAQYSRLAVMFRENAEFRADALEMSASVLAHRKIDGVDKENAVVEAAEYLLKEYAAILASPVMLGTNSVELVYHAEWPMLVNLLQGERYGIPPNPEVTFRIVNVEDEHPKQFNLAQRSPDVVLVGMSIGNSYYNERNVRELRQRLLFMYPAQTEVLPFVPDATCTFCAAGYTAEKAARVTRQTTARMLRWLCPAPEQK